MSDLAHIVEELSKRVSALEAENARLRAAAAAPAPKPVSRRNALRLGGLAAGAAGAAVFLRPGAAHAASGDDLMLGQSNDAGADQTSVTSSNSDSTLELANSSDGDALHATSTGDGAAVGALADAFGPAVRAEVNDGDASAFDGQTTNPLATAETALLTNFGKGHALRARTTNGNNTAAAILGETTGSGAGVHGISAKGEGARFVGKTAQVRLMPSTAATHPTTGKAGQLFVDKSGRLWYCKSGTNWKQLA